MLGRLYALGLISLGALVLGRVPVPCPAQESGGALLERVTTDLPAALARLEELYGRVSGTALLTEYSPPLKAAPFDPVNPKASPYEPNAIPNVVTASERISFAICDGMEKSHYVRDIRREPSVSPTPHYADVPWGAKWAKEAVACKGRDAYFRIHWPTEGSTPVLVEHGKGPADPQPALELLRSPFTYFAEPLSRTMSSGGFSIERVSKVESQAAQCLKIDYRIDYARFLERIGRPPTAGRWSRGWIVLAPGDGWVIHELVVYEEERPGRKWVRRVTYGEKEGGVPNPTCVENLAMNIRRTVLDIPAFKRGPTPSEDFTLAYFGLPDIDKPSSTAYHSRLGYWFTGGGLAAIALAVILKLRSKGRPT
jgi:hypothetical protein